MKTSASVLAARTSRPRVSGWAKAMWLALSLSPTLAVAAINIAPEGKGVVWTNLKQEGSHEVSKIDRSTLALDSRVNDGDDTTEFRLGTAPNEPRYQAAGVLFDGSEQSVAGKTITRMEFVAGRWNPSDETGLGDGVFCSDLKMLVLKPGSNDWVDSGWTVSRNYAYDSAEAAGATYVFSGPALEVSGVRVSGKVRCNGNGSYWANARELRLYDDRNDLAARPSSRGPVASSAAGRALAPSVPGTERRTALLNAGSSL